MRSLSNHGGLARVSRHILHVDMMNVISGEPRAVDKDGKHRTGRDAVDEKCELSFGNRTILDASNRDLSDIHLHADVSEFGRYRIGVSKHEGMQVDRV